MQKYKKKLSEVTFSPKKVLSLCTDLKNNMSRIYSFVDFIGRHKNVFIVLACLLYVGVIDSNSLWERHYRWGRIKQLKAEIAQLENEYEQDTRKLEKLQSDPNEVERVAREMYFMTRPGEDLFIIQTNSSVPTGTIEQETEDDEMPEV